MATARTYGAPTPRGGGGRGGRGGSADSVDKLLGVAQIVSGLMEKREARIHRRAVAEAKIEGRKAVIEVRNHLEQSDLSLEEGTRMLFGAVERIADQAKEEDPTLGAELHAELLIDARAGVNRLTDLWRARRKEEGARALQEAQADLEAQAGDTGDLLFSGSEEKARLGLAIRAKNEQNLIDRLAGAQPVVQMQNMQSFRMARNTTEYERFVARVGAEEAEKRLRMGDHKLVLFPGQEFEIGRGVEKEPIIEAQYAREEAAMKAEQDAEAAADELRAAKDRDDARKIWALGSEEVDRNLLDPNMPDSVKSILWEKRKDEISMTNKVLSHNGDAIQATRVAVDLVGKATNNDELRAVVNRVEDGIGTEFSKSQYEDVKNAAEKRSGELGPFDSLWNTASVLATGPVEEGEDAGMPDFLSAGGGGGARGPTDAVLRKSFARIENDFLAVRANAGPNAWAALDAWYTMAATQFLARGRAGDLPSPREMSRLRASIMVHGKSEDSLKRLVALSDRALIGRLMLVDDATGRPVGTAMDMIVYDDQGYVSQMEMLDRANGEGGDAGKYEEAMRHLDYYLAFPV